VKEISAMYSLTVSLCYELKDALEVQKVNSKSSEMADNFFTYIMANFETELVVMGAKIALKTYKLPFNLVN
jgi:NTP pyrophosphatase (non-canonical NTP hydrolase)